VDPRCLWDFLEQIREVTRSLDQESERERERVPACPAVVKMWGIFIRVGWQVTPSDLMPQWIHYT